MIFVKAAAAAVLLASAVHADMTSYPEPLADALAMTYEAPEEAHWRYVMQVTMNDASMQVRFDGSQPDGEQWQLVAPASEDGLADILVDVWQDLNQPDAEDENAGDGISINATEGLFFSSDTADVVAGDVVSTGTNQFTFRPDLGSDEEDDAMRSFMTGELSLAPAGHVDQIRVFAPESFKPHVAARVHAFEMVIRFDRIEGLPAPIMTLLSTEIDISAMFQRQQQAVRFEFSDVEYVEP